MHTEFSDGDSSAVQEASPYKKRATRSEGKLAHKRLGDLMLEESDEESGDSLSSSRKTTSTSVSKRKGQSIGRPSKIRKVSGHGGRKSSRSVFQHKYHEVQEDTTEDLITESEVSVSKTASHQSSKKKEREVFRTDYSDDWEERHWDICEVCRNSDKRRLIYCQGCAVAVHQECLGSRNERKHLVTRLAANDYVLQCRHCVGRGGQRSSNRSYVTGRVGSLCMPIKLTEPTSTDGKTSDVSLANDQNLTPRDSDDSGKDSPELVELRNSLYDADNVMFRCIRCLRPAMYEELVEPENDSSFEPSQCVDCNAHRDMAIHLVLGWRYLADDKLDKIEVVKKELPKEFLQEYLVKWKEHSYLKVEWVTSSWLHGISMAKKKHFDARGLKAIKSEGDVILEDYNRTEIVLDIRYHDDKTFEQMKFSEESEALEAITEVEQALIKWQQVQYDDISWDEPPERPEGQSPDQLKQRFKVFEAAYTDWVKGFYVMVDKKHATKSVKISDVPFSVLEKKKQPKNLVGGDLMPYQIEGLNWLYYQYYLKHPAILADEMGLGKTIQIISLLSVLNSDWAIAPFLIIAPNSTISNWKREFQKWAPHMRVAAFYGEKVSKEIIQEYEIVHHDVAGQPLKVHALITSYNTVETDSTFLKKYHWACLVVDEGQRLKNDESVLFKLLAEFRVNHRILLTGTPLQNNTKELFNLLQFLDPKKMNAVELENHFDIEKQESLTELHTMLSPYFLRRTKVQVLKFLPSKNEVIVPVTMTSLQKELYKTILSKNAELMRHVMSRSSTGKAIQNYNNTSLGNVLQQIRKILSHPFIYSPDIEEQVESEQQSLVNLTNACAKLLLLKVLLPILKEKGHRVLIFCQFIMMLDILEDWMNASDIKHCRIDGNTPTPERQESIDKFNAPSSEITCFLLSTRAGGVGINLATADTVIIYDADFNPHQDLQAVARAHRIGQKNKVVVFTLVTRNTAEEKILQIGRKKMVLDQLIIENMATKEENVPYQEILSFGAAALFDEEAKNELVYDTATVNNLIESSYADIVPVDDTAVPGEKSNDSFGFAKVWAGDTLADPDVDQTEDGQQASDDLWARILEQRAEQAKAEADRKSAEFSKGRKRTIKDYNETNSGKLLEQAIRAKAADEKSSQVDANEELDLHKSDTEEYSEAKLTDDSSDASSLSGIDELDFANYDTKKNGAPRVVLGMNGMRDVLKQQTADEIVPENESREYVDRAKQCKICGRMHLGGQCQIRNIPIELCTLCKTAHFSNGKGTGGRLCPVFNDMAAMKAILEDLKKSNEPAELVDQAKAYIRNAIGTITRRAKLQELQKVTQG